MKTEISKEKLARKDIQTTLLKSYEAQTKLVYAIENKKVSKAIKEAAKQVAKAIVKAKNDAEEKAKSVAEIAKKTVVSVKNTTPKANIAPVVAKKVETPAVAKPTIAKPIANTPVAKAPVATAKPKVAAKPTTNTTKK